jgi:2-polyprenyl-3-methyl-5-hydroxy-6-metoxy-1,4-benzoquinol methylase
MTPGISDNENLYGDAVSAYYDLLYPPADIPDMVRFVTELEPPGARVLDFGVGTGRTAIPLSLADYDVVGLDVSEAMLNALREKDVEERITLVRGDFTDVSGRHAFELVVCLNNTLPMVLDAVRRQQVFHNAAANLKPGGHLVLETASPFPYLRGETRRYQFAPLGRGDKVLMDVVTVDAMEMRLFLVRSIVMPGGLMTFAEQNHLLTPMEMDIMADAAGFEFVGRYAAWTKDKATDSSVMLMSVYRLPDD